MDTPNVVGESKKSGSGLRYWISIDSSGQESIFDADKYAIMQRVQIHARDLRILDPLLSYPSTILGCERAIVLNLEHIKAIITSDELLIHDPSDDNIVPILENLRRKRNKCDFENGAEDDSPFEFRALEVALEAICSYLSARALELESTVYPAVHMFTSKICGRNLDRVRKLKTRLTRLTARVQKVRDELEQLLGDDDDMLNFYLSRKLARRRGDENDVEELEMILEAYFTQIDGTFDRLTTLHNYIDNTEDYINIQLDNRRNRLIQVELFLSTGTMCLDLYSLVTAIFGMSIPYPWNDGHGYVFKWVVLLAGVMCLIVFAFIVGYAKFKRLVRF
ncbi:magnesium transporter MRS2-I-like [Andrographis paniculata]|uniref:magnesium transporter MRS2-I-like n=1 Tax=Andrographis paniculata TaxID=175694 RepID=UPI0021E7F7CB|nr:magnesium transporter MRS2-I-like [Andrographis paniculata]